MTREEAVDRLNKLAKDSDEYNFGREGVSPEYTHEDADEILCDLLTELGYEDVVEEWRKVIKWYS